MLFAAKAVVAFLLGPPCETFSAIRGDDLPHGKKGPPPPRSLEKIWGLLDATPRQTVQLSVGNTLYHTTILLAARAARYGAACIVEHPKKFKI